MLRWNRNCCVSVWPTFFRLTKRNRRPSVDPLSQHRSALATPDP